MLMPPPLLRFSAQPDEQAGQVLHTGPQSETGMSFSGEDLTRAQINATLTRLFTSVSAPPIPEGLVFDTPVPYDPIAAPRSDELTIPDLPEDALNALKDRLSPGMDAIAKYGSRGIVKEPLGLTSRQLLKAMIKGKRTYG